MTAICGGVGGRDGECSTCIWTRNRERDMLSERSG